DLRLVLQPPEGLGMHHAVTVALKRRPDGILGLGPPPPLRCGALGRVRAEGVVLALFELFANGHGEDGASAWRKPVPLGSGPTEKLSASVWPRSANVARVPRSTSATTVAPTASSGTYSRE